MLFAGKLEMLLDFSFWILAFGARPFRYAVENELVGSLLLGGIAVLVLVLIVRSFARSGRQSA